MMLLGSLNIILSVATGKGEGFVSHVVWAEVSSGSSGISKTKLEDEIVEM